MNADILGFIAATLTTIAFLPQVIKVVREKNTASISLLMYVVFTIGVALWLVYGLLLNNLPMIFSNIITLITSSIILFCKIRNKD
jgi:MtN3 and saliva related transmembrane protein